MEFTIFSILDLLGTFAFAVSGASQAMKKQFDVFGVFVLAFVTAIGGGTLRDIMLGDTPVGWMHDSILISVIIVAAGLTILFSPVINKLNFYVYIFDALGLGLFTMAGIQSGIDHDLSIFICIALGMISATFGGLIRDIITGEKPMLLTRKEIYALACALGGIVYFALRALSVPEEISVPATIVVVFLVRHLTFRFGIRLPTFGG